MSRRASLPGAAELFRSTGPVEDVPEPVRYVAAVPSPVERDSDVAALQPAQAPRSGVRQTARRRSRQDDRRPSGRERHDEKITVYVSADELFDLEQARLVLRGEHGLAVDRGRIVREALSVVIADLESRGESSTLVRKLREG